jgi:hypothetical protein
MQSKLDNYLLNNVKEHGIVKIINNYMNDIDDTYRIKQMIKNIKKLFMCFSELRVTKYINNVEQEICDIDINEEFMIKEFIHNFKNILSFNVECVKNVDNNTYEIGFIVFYKQNKTILLEFINVLINEIFYDSDEEEIYNNAERNHVFFKKIFEDYDRMIN